MNAPKHLPWRPSQAVALWSQEARATLRLAVPLVLIELAWVAMLTTDRVMMGWLGPEPLAAGALVGQYFLFFEYFAMGILVAVAPILSQHLGARRFRMVRRTFRQGMWAAVILALPCMALIWHAEAVLVLLGQDPDLASDGQSYVRYMVLGFVPGLWFVVLAEFLAAHMRPCATLVVTVLGIGINALADYALMFGHFGFPRLGLIGAGIASAVVTVFMFLALLAFVLTDWRLRRYRLLGRFWHADWSHLFEIVRLGVPIAVAHLAEIGLFLAASLLMGLISTAALAAHAIANQCALIVYMVPYGIAQAATVRVGRAAGAREPQDLSRAGWSAQALGIGFALLPAAAFWFLGDHIVDLFLDTALPENRVAIELAVSFLAIAALFQVAEASLITAQGALRGLKDTRGPMFIALAGYWGLGFTSAALFGVYLGFGGQAVWISLAVGVSVVGALLVQRFWAQSLRFNNETRQSA